MQGFSLSLFNLFGQMASIRSLALKSRRLFNFSTRFRV